MQDGSAEQVKATASRVLPDEQAVHYPLLAEPQVAQSVVNAKQSSQVWVAVATSRYVLGIAVQSGLGAQVNAASSRVLPVVQALHYPVESHVPQSVVVVPQSTHSGRVGTVAESSH